MARSCSARRWSKNQNPRSQNREVKSITTGGMESFSVEDAVELAKEMIDGGGMQ